MPTSQADHAEQTHCQHEPMLSIIYCVAPAEDSQKDVFSHTAGIHRACTRFIFSTKPYRYHGALAWLQQPLLAVLHSPASATSWRCEPRTPLLLAAWTGSAPNLLYGPSRRSAALGPARRGRCHSEHMSRRQEHHRILCWNNLLQHKYSQALYNARQLHSAVSSPCRSGRLC